MGKSALLTEFSRRIAADGQQPRCRVIMATCLPGIGTTNSYGPILDLLFQLAAAERSSGRLRKLVGATGRGAANAMPQLLSSLVPGLGSAWTVGREITEAALHSGFIPFDSLLPFQQSAALHIVDELLRLARSGPPVVLLVDDFQYIDQSSLLVLDLLLNRLARSRDESKGERLGLVLAHSGENAASDADRATSELLDTWSSRGLLTRRVLAGLPEDAVAALVRRQAPDAPAGLPAELSRLTLGHSIFVALCLDEWRAASAEGVQRRAASLPSSLTRLVERRLAHLDDGDRDLVLIGATQGMSFLSHTVAQVAKRPHDAVMERLRRISRPGDLILDVKDRQSWIGSDRYTFLHRALWEVVYEQQTPTQREQRHAGIARALQAASPSDAPRELDLEIAYHLDRGGPGCLAEAAAAHHALARSAAVDGLSFSEAEDHCEAAIRAARAMPARAEGRDRLLVEAIELLLSMTEVRWRGNRPIRGVDIDALAAEAEHAAARCDDPTLLARTALLRGKTLMATRGLLPSLDKLAEAVERAKAAADPVALYVATVEYGRQASKRRLADGLTVLLDAERMYAAEPELGGKNDPVLQHARNLGQMQLGITLFDSGRLSEAYERLRRCATRLRGEVLDAELPIALNYLAQVQLSLGLYADADETLREALDVEARRGGDSGWHANNAALLALLLARDPDRHDEALRLIEAAWQETTRTWLVNLVPIVRNLYVDVLLTIGVDDAERRRQASELIEATLAETRQTGMVRSEIPAMILRSRLDLIEGDPRQAARHAREAVSRLEEVGDMPALRTEEVYYYAAVATRASDAVTEADRHLARARATVLTKAEHITDVELRRRFLDEELLNRRILAEPQGESG
jgi:tetratricopeptide (TPR) repeat protein